MYRTMFLFLVINIAGGRTLSGGLSSRLTTETKSDSFTKTGSGSNAIPNSYLPTTQQAPTHIPSSKQSPEKSKMPETESQMISVRHILYFVLLVFYNRNETNTHLLNDKYQFFFIPSHHPKYLPSKTTRRLQKN